MFSMDDDIQYSIMSFRFVGRHEAISYQVYMYGGSNWWPTELCMKVASEVCPLEFQKVITHPVNFVVVVFIDTSQVSCVFLVSGTENSQFVIAG